MKDRFVFPLKNSRSLEVGGRTVLVGVLNVTPDSFYSGGRYWNDVEKALERAQLMAAEGADVIDIGGESTRPGSRPIPVEEELRRTIPVIAAVREMLGDRIVISVDTYKSQVAGEALESGADMVNSMGGARFDEWILEVVAAHQCPFIVYHVRGTPETMQEGEITYSDVIEDIAGFFEDQIARGIERGVAREQFIIDPGIGFGKTALHNIEIIRRLGEFKRLEAPIAIGVSRKGHLGVILKESLGLEDIPPPEERLEASLAETAIAVLNGAHMVRTHDVMETKKCVAIVDAIKNS